MYMELTTIYVKGETKKTQQFLLDFSGYKFDRQLGHNSFEKVRSIAQSEVKNFSVQYQRAE